MIRPTLDDIRDYIRGDGVADALERISAFIPLNDKIIESAYRMLNYPDWNNADDAGEYFDDFCGELLAESGDFRVLVQRHANSAVTVFDCSDWNNPDDAIDEFVAILRNIAKAVEDKE